MYIFELPDRKEGLGPTLGLNSEGTHNWNICVVSRCHSINKTNWPKHAKGRKNKKILFCLLQAAEWAKKPLIASSHSSWSLMCQALQLGNGDIPWSVDHNFRMESDFRNNIELLSNDSACRHIPCICLPESHYTFILQTGSANMRHAARCMLTRSSVSCGLITTTGSLRWLLAHPKPITAMVMHRNKTWGLVQVDGCIKWLLASTIDTISDGLCGMSTTVMGSTNHRDVTNMQFFDTLILTSSRLTPPQRPFGPSSSTKKEAKKGLWVQKEIILSNLERLAKFSYRFVSFLGIFRDILGMTSSEMGPVAWDPLHHPSPSTKSPPEAQPICWRHEKCLGDQPQACQFCRTGTLRFVNSVFLFGAWFFARRKWIS